MKIKKRQVVLAAIVLGATMAAGCSSVVVKPVSESNKDTDGTFDGRWLTTVTNTPGKQNGPGNWQFTCADQTDERLGIVTIDDGKAIFSWDQDGKSPAFVSDSGKFRFEIPTGIIASAGGTSDSQISNGDMTALIYGSLQSGKGKYTLGVAEFGNAGCTSAVKFEKM